MKLATARHKHALAREMLKSDRVYPLDHQSAVRATQKVAAAKAVTFRAAASNWITAHRDAWSSKTVLQRENMLKRFAYPIIGELIVDTIDVSLVLNLRVVGGHVEPNSDETERMSPQPNECPEFFVASADDHSTLGLAGG